MNTSICPSGPLILGYSVDYFPYIYEQFNGDFNGIFLDLFRTIAKEFGCSGVELRKFPLQRISSDYELFDGAVDRGEVLTAIDTSFIRLSDVKRYRYSTTAIRTKMLFMEKERSDGFMSDLSFFVVFPTNIFISIIVAWLIYDGLDLLHTRYAIRPYKNKCMRNFLPIFDLFHKVLYQYFYIFVFLIHDSYFNGNNLIETVVSATTFSSMVNHFRSGARKLVLTTGDKYFDENETEFFLGSNSTIIWGGEFVDDCFKLVCEDSTRVGLFYEPDLYSFYSDKELNSKCTLDEIVLPRGQKSGVPWLTQSLQVGDDYNFLISRNFSRIVMDKINFALLTVYNPDNNLILFTHYVEYEYLLAASKYLQNQRSLGLSPYSALSFEHIEIPVIIFGIGLSFSLVAFALEIVYTRIRRTFEYPDFDVFKLA